jgi:GNAT superfamily N-acetyltransferase
LSAPAPLARTPLIRLLRADDRAQWGALWDGYNAFYERTGPSAIAPAITATTFARFLDPAEPMHAFVAEEGDRLVGLAHLIFHRNTTMQGMICYLQDLFAAPEARGRGIGRALIEAVYAHAKAEGSARVYWQTQIDNATARRLYDRVAAHYGFIVYRKDL